MKHLLAILGWCLAVGTPALAAPTPQPLSITVRGDGAQATRLPEYDPSVPIAVTVTSIGELRLDELSIVATSPAGRALRVPLVRAVDGTFGGSLVLSDQGAWQLRLTSRAGNLRTDTTPVSLNVAAPPPSNAPLIGLAVGAAIFVIVGGSGFFILRRTVGSRPASGIGQAA